MRDDQKRHQKLTYAGSAYYVARRRACNYCNALIEEAKAGQGFQKGQWGNCPLLVIPVEGPLVAYALKYNNQTCSPLID